MAEACVGCVWVDLGAGVFASTDFVVDLGLEMSDRCDSVGFLQRQLFY